MVRTLAVSPRVRGARLSRVGAARVIQAAFRALQRVGQARRSRSSLSSWRKRVRSYESSSRRSQASSKRMRPSRQYISRRRTRGNLASGGLYAGKFKKGKRPSLMNRVVQRTESNGEVSAGAADEVAWVCASNVAPNTAGPVVFLAVLKRLARKMGQDFRTAHQFVDARTTTQSGSAGIFRYRYCVVGEPNVQERQLTILDSTTWGNLAGAWWNDLSAFGYTRVDFMECYIEFLTRDATTNVVAGVEARVDLSEAVLKYHIVSALKIQNRTGANAGTEVDAENIEQNPIQGKCFHLKGHTLAFQWNNDTTITPSFRPNEDSGIVTIDPQDATLNAGMQNMLKRPTNGIFKYTDMVQNVRLQPGHIKKNSITSTGSMYFNNFVNRVLMESATGANIGDMFNFGKVQAFCFEKTLRTGTGTAVVKIGYEHNLYTEFELIRKSPKPFIMENSTV